MPLQKAAVLFNTNSVFTVIIGIFYLKEIPNLMILVLIASTSFGVILLIDPSIVGLGGANIDQSQNFDCKIESLFRSFLLQLFGDFTRSCFRIFNSVYEKAL